MISIIVFSIISIVLFLLSVMFAGVWVYKDASQRGLQAGLWVLIVIFSGNFIGLILYLAIGRRQRISQCGKCGAKINAQGDFCPVCGEKSIYRDAAVKSNKALLGACAGCIVLAFVFLGFTIHSAFNGSGEGFTLNTQYSYYTFNSSGYAKGVTQKSMGDIWSLSFKETSSGYVFGKTYNTKLKPVLLTVEFSCPGSVQLIVTQNGASITETLTEGSRSFDMSEFNSGRIDIKLINIDASGFSGEITMKTESREER